MRFSGINLTGFKEINPGSCALSHGAAKNEVHKLIPVQLSEATQVVFKSG